jgi:hypothetical protein
MRMVRALAAHPPASSSMLVDTSSRTVDLKDWELVRCQKYERAK